MQIWRESTVTPTAHEQIFNSICSDPFTIIKIKGSQLEIQDKHGQTYKRNSAHVKKYRVPAEEREEEEIEHPTTKEIPQPHLQPEEENTPHPTQATYHHPNLCSLYQFPQPRKEEQQESQNHLNEGTKPIHRNDYS